MADISDPNTNQTMEQRMERLEENVSQILNLLKALTPHKKDTKMSNGKEEVEQPEVVIVTTKTPEANEVHNSAGKVNEEEGKMMNKMEILEKKVREIQGMEAYKSFDMKDFCLFSDMEIPPKFKVPDFEKFEGRADPLLHLTMYTRRMVSYHQNEKLMIHCFQHSLTGGALTWFQHLDKNQTMTWRDLTELFVKQHQFMIDITPDRFELQRMKKTEKESFREYAQRWREKASQVHPPLNEKEIVRLFVKTLDGPYFEKLLCCVTNRFSDVVIIGEKVEDAIKDGKLSGTNASLDKTKKQMFHRKEEDVQMVGTSQYPSKYKPHQPLYQPPLHPIHYLSQANYHILHTSPTPQIANIPFSKKPHFAQNQADQPRRERLTIDRMPIPYDQVYNDLLKANLIGQEVSRPAPNPLPKWYNADESCEYHMGELGHSIERCISFKVRVQKLINTGMLNFRDENRNPPGLSLRTIH